MNSYIMVPLLRLRDTKLPNSIIPPCSLLLTHPSPSSKVKNNPDFYDHYILAILYSFPLSMYFYTL